jgi:hypothetical protein
MLLLLPDGGGDDGRRVEDKGRKEGRRKEGRKDRYKGDPGKRVCEERNSGAASIRPAVYVCVCVCVRVDIHGLLLFSLPSIHPSPPRAASLYLRLPTAAAAATSYPLLPHPTPVLSLSARRRLTHATPREKRREEKKKEKEEEDLSVSCCRWLLGLVLYFL